MKVRPTTDRKNKRNFTAKRKVRTNMRFLKVAQKPDMDSDFEAHQLFSLFTAGIIKKNTDFVR
jgi:hypothetical protein